MTYTVNELKNKIVQINSVLNSLKFVRDADRSELEKVTAELDCLLYQYYKALSGN